MNTFACFRSALLLTFFLAAGPVSAQMPPAPDSAAACASLHRLELDRIGGSSFDFARLAEITGHAVPRPQLLLRSSDKAAIDVCGTVPWQRRLATRTDHDGPVLRILPARSVTVVNTGFPNDRNNGALWAGKGVAAELGGGVGLRWGPLTAALAPALLYQQNVDFVQSEWRERAFRSSKMDWPQRMSTGSFSSIEPGQSFVRIDTYGVAAGLTTENAWLGPGRSNSILLSNTAAGFEHAFLGTSEPINVHLGKLELQGIHGRLSESRFFDDDEENNRRLYSALFFSFEPSWLTGLYLGAARVFQQTAHSSAQRFPFFQTFFRGGNADEMDQLVALYARWVLVESGFEAYIEWARTDANADLHGFITEPEHSQAHVIGFQKVEEVSDRWVRIHGEFANLNPRLPAFRHNSGGYYYRHNFVHQGYTHRGQLLGASIGPGSDSQLFGVDLFTTSGSAGFYMERVRRAVDTFYRNATLRRGSPFKYDVELTAGGKALYLLGDVQANLDISYTHRRNRDFLPPDLGELEQGYRAESNWGLQLGLTWYPHVSAADASPAAAHQPHSDKMP